MNRRLLWSALGALALAVIIALVLQGGRPERAPVSPPSAAASGTAPTPNVDSPPGSPNPRPAPAQAPAPTAAAIEAKATVVEEPSATEGVVAGYVLSSSRGTGVPRAELTFEQGGASASTRTDDAGQYVFTPPKSGMWRVAAVAADGFLPFAPEWGHSPVVVFSAPGKRLKGATLWLTPAVTYRVTVVDPAGAKVPGADVRVLTAATEDQALLPLPDRYVTDSNGEAALRAPDDAILEARHPRWKPARGRIDFSAQVSQRTVIRLGRPDGAAAVSRTISGKVVDGRGAAVVGAVVSATSGDLVPGQSATDANGAFEVRDLDDGKYALMAEHEQFAPATLSGVAAGATGVAIKMEAGGRIQGTVRDRTGQPVVAFTVLEWQQSGLTHHLVSAESRFDPQGAFELGGLPSGALRVSAVAPGLAESPEVSVEAALPPNPPARVALVVSPGAKIAGVVVDRKTQAPLQGARVTLEGREDLTHSPATATRASAYTNAAGAFAIEGVRAGRPALYAAAVDHHARIISGLQVSEDAELPPVRIELSPVEGSDEPRLELTGLGIALSSKDDALRIDRVFPNGGGAEAGLQVGDFILSVEGKPVRDLGFGGSMDAIRGPENTQVRLEVKRAADGAVLSIVANRRLIRG